MNVTIGIPAFNEEKNIAGIVSEVLILGAIGKDGKVADTFSSITKPSSQRFINLIEKEIKN